MKRCPCGITLHQPGRRRQHHASLWHRKHKQIVALSARGVPDAVLARVFGMTRAYVGQRLKVLRGSR